MYLVVSISSKCAKQNLYLVVIFQTASKPARAGNTELQVAGAFLQAGTGSETDKETQSEILKDITLACHTSSL